MNRLAKEFTKKPKAWSCLPNGITGVEVSYDAVAVDGKYTVRYVTATRDDGTPVWWPTPCVSDKMLTLVEERLALNDPKMLSKGWQVGVPP